MSTHNICFHKENQKITVHRQLLMKSSADLSSKCALIRWIFLLHVFSSNFEKPKRTVR